jgi:hypothetical protein
VVVGDGSEIKGALQEIASVVMVNTEGQIQK